MLENPTLDFSDPKMEKTVYHYLVRTGVSWEDQQKRASNLFSYWESRFANARNINVFVDPNWSYFCQFTNRRNEVMNQEDHIKIYIPQDAQHLYESANQIFDFLAKNNIKHMSKIGSEVRFDDIVVRLTNAEDAKKLQHFIKKNRFIQEGLIEPNPFAFSQDNIAYACDGKISYNSMVANYIRMYLSDKQKKGTIQEININDFLQFVNRYYQKTFIQFDGIDQFLQDFNINLNKDRRMVEEIVLNYQQCTNLLLKAVNPNFTYANFINHFQVCANPQITDQMLTSIHHARVWNQSKEAAIQLFTEWINKMVSQHNYQTALLTADDFLKTNNPVRITSQDNLRNRIMNSNCRETICKILRDRNISLYQYFQELGIVEKVAQEDIVVQPAAIENSFVSIMEELLLHCDINTAGYYLKSYMTTGDDNNLLISNDLKQQLHANAFYQSFQKLLQQTNLTANQYFQTFMQNGKGQARNQSSLDRAILETYKKYEQIYAQGQSKVSGSEFVFASLSQFLKDGSYLGFTKNNNARNELIQKVSQQDALHITRSALKLPLTSVPSDMEIRLLAKQYTEMVIQNYYENKRQMA